MPRFNFTPGTEEQWDALDWHHVDPAHAWRMVEHLTAYIAQAQDCPEPVRLWLQRAFDAANGNPEKWITELGLKRGGGRPTKAGLIAVVNFMNQQLKKSRNKEQALRATAQRFRLTQRTVRAYLDAFDRASSVHDE
jgi:hypothetical protein